MPDPSKGEVHDVRDVTSTHFSYADIISNTSVFSTGTIWSPVNFFKDVSIITAQLLFMSTFFITPICKLDNALLSCVELL